MIQSNKAEFKFTDYKIIDFTFSHAIEESKEDASIKIDFEPSGSYSVSKGEFILGLLVTGTTEKMQKEIIKLNAVATFSFQEYTEFSSIPDFFYKNSIAIFFPYLRAFISTVTLQSNGPLMVLSLMNLSNLEDPLKANTKELP